jgi:hypothetical protein
MVGALHWAWALGQNCKVVCEGVYLALSLGVGNELEA